MNKQEIQNEIKKARENLERLEAKLKEPEKFKFQGGDWIFARSNDNYICTDPSIKITELPFRTKTIKDCERLAKHLKNAAIMWQVAESVNDGWTRESGDTSDSCHVAYSNGVGFDWWFNEYATCFIFKNNEAAKKACEILNNQETGYEI